jgi:Gpi18-like mannosyltransferase
MRLRPHRSNWVDLLALLALLGLALAGSVLVYRGERVVRWTMDTPPVVMPRAGLHELERRPDGSGVYRWTNGSGTLKLPNPGGTSVLRIALAGGPGRSAPVEMRAGAVSQRLVVSPDPRTYTLLVPAGSGERFAVQIDSPLLDTRARDLGVVVGDVEVRGGGAVPGAVPIALCAMTVAMYMLLRQTGLGTLPAVATMILLQALALLWQAAGGWRYALFGPALLLMAAISLAPSLMLRFVPVRPRPEAAWVRLSRPDFRVIGLLVMAALSIRLFFLTMPDPVGDLELDARRMGFLYSSGLAGTFTGGADYLPLRLYMWLFLGKLAPALGATFQPPVPAPTAILVKLPNLIADLLTVPLIYAWSRRWRSVRRSAIITALYTFAPPIWINVAWWGQGDALLMLPLLLMVMLLPRSGGRWSWVCWAVAFLIKPQAIVFAPLLYAATLHWHGRRGLVKGGAIALLLLVAGCAPLVLAGQGPGLMQAYVGSVGRFPMLTSGAYNLWYLLMRGASQPDVGQGVGGLSFSLIGLTLVGLATLLVCLALLRRADSPARAEAAAALALSFFLLPTQIHERYAFFTLPFLALRLSTDWRLVPIYLLLALNATLNIFGALEGFMPALYAFISASPLPLLISALNLLVLGFLLVRLVAITLWPQRRPRFAFVPSSR